MINNNNYKQYLKSYQQIKLEKIDNHSKKNNSKKQTKISILILKNIKTNLMFVYIFQENFLNFINFINC
jgi:hypothetical protein